MNRRVLAGCDTEVEVIPPSPSLPSVFSDEELRRIWREAGGAFDGPHTEMAYMEEAKFLPFIRAFAGHARAQGFVEGIEAAAKWHQAEFWRLVVSAETALRQECSIECAELLNWACEHARSLPAIRALAPSRADQEWSA